MCLSSLSQEHDPPILYDLGKDPSEKVCLYVCMCGHHGNKLLKIKHIAHESIITYMYIQTFEKQESNLTYGLIHTLNIENTFKISFRSC